MLKKYLEGLVNSRVSAAYFLCYVVTAQLIYSFVAYMMGAEYLPVGPERATAMGSISLWEYGTLESSQYREVYDKLTVLSQEKQVGYWQDLFSVTVHGTLVPAHAGLFSILASPFYGIFNISGLWILNNLLLASLYLTLYSLVRQLSGVTPGKHILAAILLVPLFLHSYAFSYDVFNALLIAGGIALLSRFPAIGAGLVALSVFIRPTNIFWLPVVFFPVAGKNFSRVTALLSAGSVLLLYFLSNYYLWGSPFSTARDRMPIFQPNGLEFYSATLSMDILFSDWWDKLFHFQVGFLLYAPLLVLVPWAFWAFNGARANAVRLWVGLSFIQVIVIFSFHCWNCTGGGNRFLMPVTVLLSAAVLAAVKRKSMS